VTEFRNCEIENRERERKRLLFFEMDKRARSTAASPIIKERNREREKIAFRKEREISRRKKEGKREKKESEG
jgi:hypothetical protein